VVIDVACIHCRGITYPPMEPPPYGESYAVLQAGVGQWKGPSASQEQVVKLGVSLRDATYILLQMCQCAYDRMDDESKEQMTCFWPISAVFIGLNDGTKRPWVQTIVPTVPG